MSKVKPLMAFFGKTIFKYAVMRLSNIPSKNTSRKAKIAYRKIVMVTEEKQTQNNNGKLNWFQNC